MTTREVLVIGGGPAGLAAAFWRKRQRPEDTVTVLEAAPRAGGWVRTETVDGFCCEHGPQALRPTDELEALVAALALRDELVPAAPAARQRWIGRDGRLLPTPTGPLSALTTGVLSLRGKLRLLRERKVPASGAADESVRAFAERRFGPETGPLVQAVVSGIFGGDADRLEVRSAFPLLAELEREHGSVMGGMKARRRQRRAAGEPPRPRRPALISFRGGMTTLVDRLAAALGDDLELSRPAAAVARAGDGFAVQLEDGSERRADELLLACPARLAAPLVRAWQPELAAELEAIPFASLASVYFGVPAAQLPRTMRGFGFLLEQPRPPARASNPALGAIYCSELFADHAPAGKALVRVMLGGALHPGTADLDDGALHDLAEQALRQHTGLRSEPVFRHVVRARDAIPQYDRGHGARLQRIDALTAAVPGLTLLGNSYRGIALGAQLGAPEPTPAAAPAAAV